MLARHPHQFEIHASGATLYLAGQLSTHDIQQLRADCKALPCGVRTLRIDLHAVTMPAPDAVDAVGGMLRDWRNERRGRCCLSLGHAVSSDALMATYL